MRADGVKLAARMLPHSPPLIPMKAQKPKSRCQSLLFRRQSQPNPFANYFRLFVLLGKLRPQVIQDRFRGQFAVFAVFYKFLLFRLRWLFRF